MLGTHSTSPIGIDVGARSIKAVQLAHGRRGTRIVAIALIERQANTHMVGAAEATYLRSVLSRQGFRGSSICLAAPAQRLLSGVMELPPRSSGAPMDHIARVELARANSCSPEDIEMAWWELPAGSRAVEGTHVFAVGLRHEDAGSMLDGFEAAGFHARTLDAGALALARVGVAAKATAEGRLVGLVDIGWGGANLAVLLGRTLVYQRLLPEMGLSNLHKQLVTQLSVDSETAEFVVRKVGVDGDGLSGPQAGELLDDARAVAAEHCDGLATEIKASLSYALRRYGASGAQGVWVVGGGACVPGYVERLRSGVSERVDALRTTDVACAPDDAIAGELAADPRLTCAAGLAMDGARMALPEVVPA